MRAEAVGDVHLYFDKFWFIILRHCFYVPSFKRNLISVACLIKDSYSVSFSNKVVIRKNNYLICNGWMHGNLYFIKPKMHSLLDTNWKETLKDISLLTLPKRIFGIYD